ncbi:MAG: hypothetical protein ACRDSR_03190 [Pseudonocardiaceae bacterium]
MERVLRAGLVLLVALLTAVWLLQRRLIYFGESLGAAVATRLATEQPPAGLVLRSPFTCLAAVGSRHYPLLPVRLLLRDRFPVTELIGRIRVPTAVVYGFADTIVPPAQSAAVATAAQAVELPADCQVEPFSGASRERCRGFGGCVWWISGRGCAALGRSS